MMQLLCSSAGAGAGGAQAVRAQEATVRPVTTTAEPAAPQHGRLPEPEAERARSRWQPPQAAGDEGQRESVSVKPRFSTGWQCPFIAERGEQCLSTSGSVTSNALQVAELTHGSQRSLGPSGVYSLALQCVSNLLPYYNVIRSSNARPQRVSRRLGNASTSAIENIGPRRHGSPHAGLPHCGNLLATAQHRVTLLTGMQQFQRTHPELVQRKLQTKFNVPKQTQLEEDGVIRNARA
ncbi:hypothetical protein NDU88_003865 [Pleurodeles waltl]|uniref:Uncharacterized protein n=1 Tax=Pleurodeles waltl TaxID=8319 RepID=A0AAV7LGF3_PLEWA|nr:hypothetical protein NDU88_003865 [Pleurodeles waltl]